MKGALGCLEGSRCGLLWRPKTSNTTLKPGAESAQSTYRQGRPRVHFGQKKLDIVICETPPLLVVLLPPPLHPRTASPLSKPQLQQISEWVQLLQTPVLILPDRLSYSSHSIHHKCSFFFRLPPAAPIGHCPVQIRRHRQLTTAFSSRAICHAGRKFSRP